MSTPFELGSSPDDLSYSMFLDRIQQTATPHNTLDVVRPRVGPAWIPDDAVTMCYACRKYFTFIRRIHHCRACSRAFCHACSSKSVVLPKNLDAYPENPKTAHRGGWFSIPSWTNKGRPVLQKTERVCDRCFGRITLIYSLEAWIHVFEYLDIKEVSRISQLGRVLRRAGNVYKSIFRDIQYVLPGYSLSPIQERLLRINQPYIGGHSRLLIKMLTLTPAEGGPSGSSRILELLSVPKTCKCWNLMCTRQCHSIDGFDVLEVLDIAIPYVEIRRFIVSRLDTLSDQELECILPTVVFALRYEIPRDTTLLDFLVKRSLSSITIRTSVFWMLAVLKSRNPFFTPFFSLFMAKLDGFLKKEVVFDQLLAGRRFLKQLAAVPRDEDKARDTLKRIVLDNSIPSPLDPSVRIKSIIQDQVHVKDSITSPILIPLQCVDNASSLRGETAMTIRKDILFKKEDLLKDHIIMNVIRLMDQILKRDEGIDFGILTYRVLPISNDSGFIEIIPNAETLYSIQHRLEMTIQNFLLDRNKDLSINTIRDRFIKSAAAYCVISYLLGVGDRHLDNIMIEERGYLFHIDYGFVLGQDNKILAPAIRLTAGIVDALGGTASQDYARFKQICIQIYNCLRRYTHLFLSLLNILTEDGLNIEGGKYKKDRVREEILARFVPSENATDAESQILFKIDESYNSTTPRVFIDMTHYYMKEIFRTKPRSVVK